VLFGLINQEQILSKTGRSDQSIVPW